LSVPSTVHTSQPGCCSGFAVAQQFAMLEWYAKRSNNLLSAAQHDHVYRGPDLGRHSIQYITIYLLVSTLSCYMQAQVLPVASWYCPSTTRRVRLQSRTFSAARKLDADFLVYEQLQIENALFPTRGHSASFGAAIPSRTLLNRFNCRAWLSDASRCFIAVKASNYRRVCRQDSSKSSLRLTALGVESSLMTAL
jgi:hypothetical protein